MDSAVGIAIACALVVGVARVLGGALERLGQPRVMGEVLAGLVLGASVLGLVPGDPSADLFTGDARDVMKAVGTVGVVAYLAAVGASLDRSALREDGRAVTLVALGSFAVPFVAGALLALALHDEVAGDPPRAAFALFLGTALAVTAFPVLARLVDARGLRERVPGRVALAAAAAQEGLVWPALAVAVAVGASGPATGDGVLGTLGAGVLGVVAVVVLARIVVPFAAARTSGGARVAVLLAGLGLSAGATELAGLHAVLGAFLVGVLLPRAPRAALAEGLHARPTTIALAVLLPLFFAAPALGVDLTTLGADGVVILGVVLVVAVAAKLLSATAAAALAGLPRADALTVGVLMNARGLVELLVLTIGLQAGLVDERLFAVLVVVALVTTFATGPLLALVERRRGAAGGRSPGLERPGHAFQRP